MKKAIILLLTLCILLVSVSVITANAEEPLYTYDSNTKTLTINIQGEMKYGHTNAPWLNIEYPEHIVLKKGVTSIPDFGFSFTEHGNGGERSNNYDRIKTVKLPDTLKTIGWGAFDNCHKLEKINIPESVTSIGEEAFSYTKLKKIIIPGSVKELGYGTFRDCDFLESVTLKNGVERINQYVFFNCQNLKSIEIPNSVKVINDAFVHCNSLKTIKLPKYLKTINYQTFYSCEKLEKVIIQNNVTNIEEFAFDNCASLKRIIIPKSVKKIGKKALGYENQDEKIKGFTIKGYKGSVAEKYAKKNKFKFLDITVKENQSIKISSIIKTIRVKKLRKNTQTIKPVTVKNAVGKVKYTLIKKGTSKKLWKHLRINNKSLITVKKWKNAKTGIYKIKIKVTASGNWEYKKYTKTKTIKIKIK